MLSLVFFWFCVGVIFYGYLGYPLMLYILRPFLAKPISRGPFEPAIDLIIPAYNEEKVIGAKISNTLALDYAADKLNIWIVSDASTDRTDAIVQDHLQANLRFLRQDRRLGKAAALNLGLDHARNDIVVFSDASILLARSALKQILRPLHDPHVGCVSGEDQIPGASGEGLYGRYELLIRNLESHCGSIVGASGCFYAQRRELCPRFTEGRAPDFISVLETVRKGFRAVTEPRAVGLMGKVSTSKDEFQRKVRTIVRGITALMDYPELLNPLRHGLFGIALLSHKIVRWFAGWFMAAALAANLSLAGRPLYTALLVLQLAFYSLAAVGWYNERGGKSSGRAIFRIPLYFCIANFAAMSAAVKYAAGARQEIWDSSRRS
jgi:cellulose synthase/poly-beta-1,6-N-acetylglucosamine synthase-like glycosyltransferase